MFRTTVIQTIKTQVTTLLVIAMGIGVSGCEMFVSPPAASLNAPQTLDPSREFNSGNYVGIDMATITTASVCLGSTLFGLPGTAICQNGVTSTPAGASDVAAGKEYWNEQGQKIVGTMTTRASFSGDDGKLVFTIPTGYYGGTQTARAVDSNLAGSNICKTKTIFGVTGTKVCQTGTGTSIATASDIIAGKEAWDDTGTKLTGTIVNQGNLNPLSAWPGAGYYGANLVNTPLASDICSGVSILGVSGMAPCSGGGQIITLYSNIHRDKATTPLSWADEVNRGTCSDTIHLTRLKCETSGGIWTPSAMPTGYRNVPDTTKDTDGYGVTGVMAEFTLATRPTVDCGTSQNTIVGRIADCLEKNGASATWDGVNTTGKGNNAGFGVWKLVTRIGASTKEVWQDQRTGLLWSSILSVTATNYCKASGNAQSTDIYCNPSASSTYQVAPPGLPVSFCAEDAGLAPGVTGENWSTGVYTVGKGGMGKVATSSSPSVIWRLPTLGDYMQANLNGIRFVMPDMISIAAGTQEWTATVFGQNTTQAWRFHPASGDISPIARTTNSLARCVGR